VLALSLARLWYALSGLASLLLVAGHIQGVLQGSRIDPPLAACAIALGFLAIAAAAWVHEGTPLRRIVVGLGIVAGLMPFAWGTYVAATTAQSAFLYAAVPSLVALGAAWRMLLAWVASARRGVSEA
jgi:hypothetical protein